MATDQHRGLDQPRTGGCLCGAVSYSVTGPLRSVLHCHCENCRRISGNHVAATGCATTDLVIHDQTDLRWFDLGYARYGFCHRCGSHLFWIGSEHEDQTSIQAGSIDDPSELHLAGIWFADEAQPHVVLDPDVPHHSGNGASSPEAGIS